MQKILNVIFIVLFAAFGAFISSSRTEAKFTGERAENAATPKSLYLKNCARCHGADGKSQTETGKSLDAPDLTTDKSSVGRNVRIITKGAGEMPAFGKKLKNSEITALANYVRAL